MADPEVLKVVILGTAHPYRGGLAAYNERLARALIDRGCEVHIVTFTMQYPSFLFPGSTQYSSEGAPPGLHIVRRLNSLNPFSWWRTARQIRRYRPDILITKFWIPFMAPAFGTVARLCGKKIRRISILDNVIPHEKRLGDKLLIRYFTSSQDAFIAMSRSVENDLRLFEQSKPCAFNPHPLYDHFGERSPREQALNKLGLDVNYRYLLFFGLIRDYKGLDLLLNAMANEKVRALKVRLIVAGEFYSDPKPYHDLIQELGLSENLVLRTEFIPDSQVADYFNAADIIVQPYRTATQSGVTQVAYHFEKPMLVTDVGGLAEIVPHGKAGYVVNPRAEDISDALLDFYSKARYPEMLEHVRNEKRKYSWDLMIDKIFELSGIAGKIE
jgi:D-inositol-3-phosphate glycosyltransferase